MSPYRIDKAIDKALDFMRSRQYPDGLWRDFETLAGSSSDWISAFVAYAISAHGVRYKTALSALKSLMSRQRVNGGWAYNEHVPTDCDSTAWMLIAMSTASVGTKPIISKAIEYILSHQNHHLGGFSTYAQTDRIHEFIQLPEHLLIGWFNVHPDVTSLAIQSLLSHDVHINNEVIRGASQYIQSQKNTKTHLWDGYWWKGYAYSTYNALKALSICGDITQEEIQRSIDYFIVNQMGDGGWNDSFGYRSEAFATAFSVLALTLSSKDQIIQPLRKGTDWLISQQNHDGSWPSSPILRIPPPMITNPKDLTYWRTNELGSGVVIADKGRVFTSAAAIWALLRVKRTHESFL